MENEVSRRRLMQLLGAGGAAALAGCGGGGGEESPTATATETSDDGGGQDTPTETEAMDTPTGQVTVTDQMLHDTTNTNFEQFHPNEWNAESGANPDYQHMSLTITGASAFAVAPPDDPLSVVYPLAAQEVSVDLQNSQLTIQIRDDLTWGDGTPFTIDNVIAHADLLYAQIELGEQDETTMPVSIDTPDDQTMVMQLLPGNPGLRALEALFSGTFTRVAMTHPKVHQEFIEGVRDATSTSETESVLQDLFSFRPPQSAIPKMALGPFKATDWNPSRMLFEARENFPWGLDYHEVDRVFSGIRWTNVSEETNLVNAALAGNKDWIGLSSRRVADRFGDEWTMLESFDDSSTTIYFSPDSQWGKKSEKALNMRKAATYLFDNEEFVAINDLVIAYEQTTGFSAEKDFKEWIGNDYFMENFTNYGHGDTGFVFEEKGYEHLRQAGFERNKDGTWVDSESGDALTVEMIMPQPGSTGMTRPVLNNIPEQFNRHGIKMSGKIPTDEEFDTRTSNFDFEMGIMGGQADIAPHPYFGFREDVGLGSRDGLPASIASFDWRNGYRRVQVPMPVGDPDGDMTTYDFDQKVKSMVEIDTVEGMQERIRELSWVLNQWVPGIYTKQEPIWLMVRSPGRIKMADDYEQQFYGVGGDDPRFPFITGGGFWTPP